MILNYTRTHIFGTLTKDVQLSIMKDNSNIMALQAASAILARIAPGEYGNLSIERLLAISNRESRYKFWGITDADSSLKWFLSCSLFPNNLLLSRMLEVKALDLLAGQDAPAYWGYDEPSDSLLVAFIEGQRLSSFIQQLQEDKRISVLTAAAEGLLRIHLILEDHIWPVTLPDHGRQLMGTYRYIVPNIVCHNSHCLMMNDELRGERCVQKGDAGIGNVMCAGSGQFTLLDYENVGYGPVSGDIIRMLISLDSGVSPHTMTEIAIEWMFRRYKSLSRAAINDMWLIMFLINTIRWYEQVYKCGDCYSERCHEYRYLMFKPLVSGLIFKNNELGLILRG